MSKKVLFLGFAVATVAAVTAKLHANHHCKCKAELHNQGVDLDKKPAADVYLVPRGCRITLINRKLNANRPFKLHGFK